MIATSGMLGSVSVVSKTATRYFVTLALVIGVHSIRGQDCVSQPAGLVGWWRGEGTAVDFAGNIDAIPGNRFLYAQGVVEQAFQLNGRDQYLELPASAGLNPSGSFSIEAWIYPTGSGAQAILGKWGDTGDYADKRSFIFAVIPGSRLQFSIADMAHQWDVAFAILNSPNNAIELNSWSHVAAVYEQESGTRRMYVNGDLVAARSDTPIRVLDSAIKAAIGATYESSTAVRDMFEGIIDEIAFYSRALSVGEIAAIYNAKSAGKCRTGEAPRITVEPESQSISAGTNLKLAAAATGTGPLNYQWFFDGAIIPGATNAALTVLDVQEENAGAYHVVVTSPLGAAASATAVITVEVEPECFEAPTGLASWWTGDGNAADKVGGVNGVTRNGAQFVVGRIGSAFQFNGMDQHVELPNTANLNPTGSFTIEAWVFPTSNSAQAVLSKWGDRGGYADNRSFILAIVRTGALQFGISDAARQWDGSFHVFNTENNAVPLNSWSHVAAVYEQESGTRRMYVNGALAAERIDTPITVLSSDIKAAIGATLESSSSVRDDFFGMIDELSFYLRALSNSEISAIYNAGPAGKCPIVVPTAITLQPRSQAVFAGQTASFEAIASGTPELAYQWMKDSRPISGATEAVLTLAGISTDDVGNYSVVIGNAAGSTTSALARLTVLNPISESVTVSTLAGSGVAGFSEGLGMAAQFNSPNDVFVAPDGLIYVADAFNHRIRRVTPSGEVSTFSGTGVAGFMDGPSADAQFNYPLGICVGIANDVFVADTENNRIRRISPVAFQTVTTVSGTGQPGYTDGSVELAKFNFPNDLALDSSGDLYVSEFNNHTIRKVTPGGTVTTFAGGGAAGYADGLAKDARFNGPAGLAIDASGILYVSEWGNQRIRRVASNGDVSTLAGSGERGFRDGIALAARFNEPDDLAVDSNGNVFVVEHGNHAVRRIAQDGTVMTVAGNGRAGFADGPGRAAMFFSPVGLAIEPDGSLIVVDSGNQLLRRIRFTQPPQIEAGPASQTAFPGTSVTLRATASGAGPFAYQWRKNGVDLPGADRSTLILSRVTELDAGYYTVVIRNSAGTVSTMPAELTLAEILPLQLILPRIEDGIFRVSFTGEIGDAYTIFRSADLINWIGLTNFVYTGEEIIVRDFEPSDHPLQFFRTVAR